jgi:Haemolymph juvenile hormone binding protein (JHBP)
MDWKNNAIVYSQYFPEKSLDGLYEFESKVLGNPITNHGNWSLVLYNYSQTTTVRRIGGPGGRLKVNVEVDKIGNMKLHISDLLGGRVVMENIADFLINNAWQPSLPFVKPLINDLVSTAFTDIFNDSFRYFPIEKLFKY